MSLAIMVFSFDNNKMYKSFYRSDLNFQAEIHLEHLRIDEHI